MNSQVEQRNLTSGNVEVTGQAFDDASIRSAVEDAGYEVA
jgi:hypothetical protein